MIATAGLVYELLAGTLASYVLGDSVTQFSTTIGAYLFAMGIGAYLSKFVRERVSERFVAIELGTALVGGFSAPFLFVAFANADYFVVILYGTILVIGTLVGLEIPLMMRILKEELDFEDLVAKVLTFDYLGALLGSILFAIVLVPELGLNRTSLLLGLLSCGVALMSTWVLAPVIAARARLRLRIQGFALAAALIAGLVMADDLTRWTEQSLYADPIVYAEQSEYQRIVLTRGRGSTQLFLNGNLQFSSIDEHRYHEALVHPAMAVARRRARVLVLGGGDGLALREIFRHPDVEHVTLVDLDSAVVEMARRVPFVRQLNRGALDDPRVEIVHDDAMVWLDERPRDAERFDVVIVDFPDPNNFSLGKLYTSRFYALAQRALSDDGVLAVQSTSPFFARKSYWCIVRTIEASGLAVQPYHAVVPSFGEWGFVLAKRQPFDPPEAPRASGLRFLDPATMRSLFVFGRDMGPVPVETNRLETQILVQYYEAEWALWN